MEYTDLPLARYVLGGKRDAVGVHIIFIAHTGVWHPFAWERWATEARGTRLILHQEKEHAFPFEVTELPARLEFREKYNVPPEFRFITGYGNISVVDAIVSSLKYAFNGGIPADSTFSIVSGDSFPLQPAARFKLSDSVIAIQEIVPFPLFSDGDAAFPHGVVLHSMDMLLNRADAEILITEFDAWRDKIIRYASDQKTNADEFAIGTILHHYHSTNPSLGYSPRRREIGGWLKKTVRPTDPLSSFPIDLNSNAPLHHSTLEFPIPDDTTQHGVVPAGITGRDVGESLLARAWPYSDYFWFRKLLPTPGITDARLWSKVVEPFIRKMEKGGPYWGKNNEPTDLTQETMKPRFLRKHVIY
jgi:hypothetical protein